MNIQWKRCLVIRWTTILSICIAFQNIACTTSTFLDEEERYATRGPFLASEHELNSSRNVGERLLMNSTSVQTGANQNDDDYELQILMKLEQIEKDLHEQQALLNEESPSKTQLQSEGTTTNYYINNESMHTSLADFTGLCIPYFASWKIRKDDLITDIEIAEFFEYLCNELDNPSCRNTDIPFYSLDTMIQRKFIRIICPRDADDNPDEECLNDLNQQDQLALEITDENEQEVNRNMEIFCEEMYPLSTEFHFGSLSPSPYEPSSSPTGYISSTRPSAKSSAKPSFRPSAKPSMRPTNRRPTEPTISPKPSITRSNRPSSKPSQSNRPSLRPSSRRTNAPMTSQPTSRKRYSRSFSYMIGVDDTTVLLDIIGGDKNDVLDSMSDAIETKLIFSSPTIIRNEGSDTNAVPITNNLIVSSVEHKYKTETVCNDRILKSISCVIIVSEVTLESSGKFSEEDIDNSVYPYIQASMADGSFYSEINRNGIQEIVYINNGEKIPEEDPSPRSGPGGTAIAAIVLSIGLCVVGAACFVGRRRGRYADERIVERNFDDSNNDHNLYLDDEHFEKDDLEYISAYQQRIKRTIQTKSKGIGSNNGSNENTIAGSDNKDTFNDFPAVLTTNQSTGSPYQDDDSFLDGEHFDDNDIEFTAYKERTKKGGFGLYLQSVRNNTSKEKAASSIALKTTDATLQVINVDTESSSYESEPRPSLDTLLKSIENEGKITKMGLNEALNSGDWNKIAAFAGDNLSTDDDISALSFSHSGGLSFDPSITRLKNSDVMEASFLETSGFT